MKANEAKKHVAATLNKFGVAFTKLRAKKISFIDLTRGESYFVTPIGMKLPNPHLQNIKQQLPKGVILNHPGIIPDSWRDEGGQYTIGEEDHS